MTDWSKRVLDLDENIPARKDEPKARLAREMIENDPQWREMIWQPSTLNFKRAKGIATIESEASDAAPYYLCGWCGSSREKPTIMAQGYGLVHVKCAETIASAPRVKTNDDGTQTPLELKIEYETKEIVSPDGKDRLFVQRAKSIKWEAFVEKPVSEEIDDPPKDPGFCDPRILDRQWFHDLFNDSGKYSAITLIAMFVITIAIVAVLV